MLKGSFNESREKFLEECREISEDDSRVDSWEVSLKKSREVSQKES